MTKAIELKVMNLQKQLREGVAELVQEPAYAEVGEDDLAMDLAASLALQEAHDPSAREFLMRELGWIPVDYERHRPSK